MKPKNCMANSIFQAEIFSQGNSSDTVAQQWLESYRKDATLALLDLINCVLQCIGCEQEVTIDDIRDPDNIPNRLRDLENSYLEVRDTPALLTSPLPRLTWLSSIATRNRISPHIQVKVSEVISRFASGILCIMGRAFA